MEFSCNKIKSLLIILLPIALLLSGCTTLSTIKDSFSYNYIPIGSGYIKSDPSKDYIIIDNGSHIVSLLLCVDGKLVLPKQTTTEKCYLKLLNRNIERNKKELIELGGLGYLLASDTGIYDVKLLAYFLNIGLPIDSIYNTPEDTQKLTALQTATLFGKYEAVDFLIQNGASVSLNTYKDKTALDIAKNINTKRPTAQSQQVLNLLLNAQTKDSVKNESQASFRP